MDKFGNITLEDEERKRVMEKVSITYQYAPGAIKADLMAAYFDGYSDGLRYASKLVQKTRDTFEPLPKAEDEDC